MKIFFGIAILFGMAILAGPAGAEQPAAPLVAGSPASALLAERSMGSDKAPVTIIDYSSLTCPHCADFHIQILPRIKKDFIENGAVRLIYRDFPLDGAAMAGAMVARCAPPHLYFRFLDALFETQAQWSRAPDPGRSLARVALLGGMSAKEVEACLDNGPLLEGIQAIKAEAHRNHGINSTPTFIINGVKHSIASYGAFLDIVNPLLDEAKKKKP